MELSDKKLPISDGVNYLKDGYISYAAEVISERAIVNLYDGLKPVNRRILWTFNQNKRKGYVKSGTIAGNTMTYHPHSDDAIYKASVPMTDNNGFSQFPLLDGSGSFGDVSSGARAAAARYTEMKLHTNSAEMFRELDGIEMVPNYDATTQEPSVLPASFPYVLVNASEGIAVGFSSKIPSFNFNDVIDLTIECIEDGECHTVITPDFSTGGYYIQNNKELQKLMKVGKASLKLRGKSIIHGKEIIFNEVPYGKTVAGLKKQIESKDIDGIKDVSNLCGYEGTVLSIECSSKNKVDEVMYYLMKDTDLQYTYNANITVVQNGAPRQLGVWNIIKEWVEWRKKVVTKNTECQLEACKQRMRESEAFMNLISNEDKKLEFTNIVIKEGREAGREYLMNNFSREEIPEDLIKWVGSRSLSDYHNGGKYASDYQAAKSEIKSYENDLANIDQALIRDLKRIKNFYGKNMQRRTEVTLKDYEFAKEAEVQAYDDTPVVYAFKNNFLKKLSYTDNSQDYEYQFKGKAYDTLIAFDNRGRLLRIYAKDLNLCSPSETGVYLPVYLGLQNETDDYKIMWIGVLDGGTKMLLYKDGNVGFLDTSEFVDSGRQVRVLQNGVHKTAGLVGAVLEEVPEVVMITDSDGRLSIVSTVNIKRKGRTARTRVFNVKKPISGYYPTTTTQAMIDLANISNYTAPSVKFLSSISDFRGTGKEFISMN